MALGGGTFLVQNKILPGAYINFISVANASASLSDRGIATLPLPMDTIYSLFFLSLNHIFKLLCKIIQICKRAVYTRKAYIGNLIKCF